MKVNFKRMISGMAVLMLLCCLMPTSVSAGHVDLDRLCRLKMVLEFTNDDGSKEPVQGAVGLYQVALAYEDRGDQIYDLTAAFKATGLDVRNIDSEKDLLEKVPVQVLEEHIAEYNLQPKYEDITDARGVVKFSSLPAGLYLVTRVPSSDGPTLYTMNSFLVTLPVMDDNDEPDYRCNVPVMPKMEVAKDLIDIKVIKQWKGDKEEERPQSVTINLLNEEGLIAETQELTKAGNWTCTFYDKPADVFWTVEEKAVKGYKSQEGEITLVDNHYEVIIINTRDKTQPLAQTGQLNWPVPILTVGGLVLILGGYALCHERKRNQE